MKDDVAPDQLVFDKMLNAVEVASNLFGVTTEEILGKCRKRRICDARNAVIYFLWEVERNKSWENQKKFSKIGIGRAIQRDHAAICNSIQNVKDLVESEDPDFLPPFQSFMKIMGCQQPWRNFHDGHPEPVQQSSS